MKMKKIRSTRSKEKTEKCISVNFTPTEYAHFLTMKEESGVPSLSLFIKVRIFNEIFRVIKVDRSLAWLLPETDDFVRAIPQCRSEL